MQTIHNKPHFFATRPDVDTLTAWREQLTLATSTPLPPLTQPLLAHERDYLPRFAQHYHRLRALPRRLRRSLQRQWKQSLAGMALLLSLGQAPALAATINVSGNAQTQAVIPLCSLVDAITAANTDTATGGCPAGSGADTIVLPTNSTQTLTAVNNTTRGATGLPVIISEITIQGNGSTIHRTAGSPEFRIIAVNFPGDLTLQSTTISGGSITLADPTFGLNDGGGIANYSGTVTLTDSTVTGNSAGRFGGGVINRATMTLTNSTVSGNYSANSYGGVDNYGTMTLTHSTVSGNSARVYVGGVNNAGGTMTLTNSTVSGNSARASVGGVANGSGGTLTLTNSTVSGNSAGNEPGGVLNGVNNGGGTLILSRTLISGNIGGSSPEVRNYIGPLSSGTVIANDFNLFGHDGDAGVSNFTPGPTDIVPGGPVSSILTPLADNGGPTLTHALVTGSPALDAAGLTCSATDQRGITRPQGPACDIGAFELLFTLPTVCDGEAITIFGTNGNDVITGTFRRDVIHALAGNDQVSSLAGNDIICGGSGNDSLNGGLGNDRLFGEAGVDTAQFFSSTTGVTVNLATGTATGLGTVTGLGSDTLSTIENVLGTAVNDTLIGNGGDNVLNGAGGNDELIGVGGNDSLIGGAGNDTAQFFGNVSINASLATGSATGLGSDTMNAIENLIGGNLADTLTGNFAANLLSGGGGNDTLNGLGGNDTLLGGTGDDALNGGAGDDAMTGSGGTDTCNGQAGTGDSATACETVSGVP